MLTKDSTYLKAKKVKDGSEKLSIEFEHLNEFLVEKYAATLLNADIYYEPVFKDSDPSLRLIIDSELEETKLPIYYKERRLIGEKFIEILKQHNTESYLNLSIEHLNIKYIIFDEMCYEEARLKISNQDILKYLNESSIIKLITYQSQYIFFYANAEKMRKKKDEQFEQEVLNALIKLFEQKGYFGPYTSKIHIFFDCIDSLRNTESEYNYLR